MPRYAFQLEYDGSGFAGWQKQANSLTVQECVEAALRRLDDLAGSVVAAGRTDSGVHALCQVIHCDLDKGWEGGKLCDALNAQLRPHAVAAVTAVRTDAGFSARFSAVRRSYLYRLMIRRAPMVLERQFLWQLSRQLDVGRMREAAEFLIGRHDFTTFRSAHCQADSPVKTLDGIKIETFERSGGLELRVRVTARSFLHRQVRSFVGTLERVGAGMMPPEGVREALEARDRSRCGPVAPARGLYLERVDYDPDPFAAGSAG
ncbi:MAG: tRNA pseudouridine(38-40) synthase TruA [Rhodobacteraceae bacterium]|nr:tRNA pseudouridine(38-40) synthase TruA [Paracoccaceae bacterium]